MKKKIFIIIVIIFGLFLVSACGGNPHKDEPQYEIYELAQKAGFTGTYEEWLASIKGADGKSAYELYIEKHPDYKGTEDQWLDDLVNDRLGNQNDRKGSYTVKFNTYGGTKIEDQIVKELGRIKKTDDPVRPGYIFAGWYVGDEKLLFNHYVVVEDVTIESKWIEVELEIECNNDFSKPIKIGDKVKLDFKVTNLENCNEFIYEIDNKKIVKIENGNLVALNEGKFKLTATSKFNPKYSLTVEGSVIYAKPIAIEIYTRNDNLEMRKGSQLLLFIKPTPDYVEVENIKWSVNNETLATIDSNGVLRSKNVDGEVIVTAKVDNVSATITIKISGEHLPNLNGYNIRIANSQYKASSYDPFSPYYNFMDKEERQKAWREVEKDFNCTITVDPYPESAFWGPSRWKYITDCAFEGYADYDFYTVPDSKICLFANNDILLDLTNLYNLHGKKVMDPMYVKSGTYKNKIYGLCINRQDIYSVLYYNIGLFEDLQKTDPTLVEPAKLFNDGKWTYTTFINYLEKVQKVMEIKYGLEGKAGAENQNWFAASGYDAFYYSGLTQNDGDPVANIETKKISLNTPHRQQAADVVKTMYNKGYAAKKQGVDSNDYIWNSGQSLFATGDLWFVKDRGRWQNDLWGYDTRYGYVPWPMPDDMTLKDYKVAIGGTNQWVMPKYRDYSSFGEECTPENIYFAVSEIFRRSTEAFVKNPNYNKEKVIERYALNYADSVESQKAFITIRNYLEEGRGYFDPVCVNDNPICSLYTNGRISFRGAVNNYANGIYTTWGDATKDLVPNLEYNLEKVFG